MRISICLTGATFLLAALTTGSAAEAKLGEDIGAYKAKVAKVYTSKGQSSKDGKTNYLFSINSDPKIKEVAPDFGGGVNITCDSRGKIIGQSMALRLGKNIEVGKTLAVRYVVDFSFESLGRSIPKDHKTVVDEVNSYATAINTALIGTPQSIRYPKVVGKITVTKQSDDSLVFAATPN